MNRNMLKQAQQLQQRMQAQDPGGVLGVGVPWPGGVPHMERRECIFDALGEPPLEVDGALHAPR